jgi:Zn-dependent peptidase ImmA (M78 family)
MNRLYERLAAANLDKSFLKKTILPEWWSDEMAVTDAGYARGLGIISSHLGIGLQQLWDDSAQLCVPSFGRTNFKLNANRTESDVSWTKCVALSAARLVVQAIRVDYKPLPKAKKMREEILAAGADYVTLPALLAYLWGHGVPVLFVQKKPAKSKLMDGVVATIDGRPVIVLSKRKSLNSLLLFILAHETGHIVRGHLNDQPVLVDSHIDRSEDKDQQEREANQSALEALTGSPNIQFLHDDKYIDAEALAKIARNTALETQIDPAVIVQNFAWGRIQQGAPKEVMYALATKASTIIEGDKSPVGLIQQVFLKHIDRAELSAEDDEFLMNVTFCGEPDAVAAGQ